LKILTQKIPPFNITQLISENSQGHVARGSPQMMSLANSLIYQRLFQQNDSGEKVHEGSAAEKAVTYDLGVKGIPDDVVWALSAVNLDQYDVPQWKITLNKGGVNLNMSWKQPDDEPKHEMVSPREDEKPSVIKKINFPVGKLLNSSEASPVPYLQRVPQMQSILSMRPDQFHRLADQRHSVITSSVENASDDRTSELIKANSVESPPQREKSDEELEPHSSEMKIEAMDVDKNTAGLIGNKRYLSTEASDISEHNELQIDESEGDIDVTDGDAPNRNEWASQPEEPARRKSPIEMLLEHRAQQIQSAQSAQNIPAGQNGQAPPAFQAMGLGGLYGNPLFHQNLRNQVLQNRGITPQTLPLLLPNTANSIMSNSQKPNPFSLDALKNVQRSGMISPVGRSPVPGMNQINVNQNRTVSDSKGAKDKGPFACSLCGRTFSLRGNLLRHERIHRGDKPFRCRFCNKAFIQRTDVMAHERVHTGEKPFACTYCGKRFPRRSTMKEHEKSFCRARNNSFDIKKDDSLGNENSGHTSDSDEKESRLPFPDKALAHSSGTSSANSSEGCGSKTPSPEHPSQMSDTKIPDASDFSVSAVIAQ